MCAAREDVSCPGGEYCQSGWWMGADCHEYHYCHIDTGPLFDVWHFCRGHCPDGTVFKHGSCAPKLQPGDPDSCLANAPLPPGGFACPLKPGKFANPVDPRQRTFFNCLASSGDGVFNSGAWACPARRKFSEGVQACLE